MIDTTARSPEAPKKATPEDLRKASTILDLFFSLSEIRDVRRELSSDDLSSLREGKEIAVRIFALADELDSPPSMQERQEVLWEVVSHLRNGATPYAEKLADQVAEIADSLSRRLQETSEPPTFNDDKDFLKKVTVPPTPSERSTRKDVEAAINELIEEARVHGEAGAPPSDSRTDTERLDWLEKNASVEQGIDYDSGEITLHRVTGPINDREWHEIARAETLREAIDAAIASSKGEKPNE